MERIKNEEAFDESKRSQMFMMFILLTYARNVLFIENKK